MADDRIGADLEGFLVLLDLPHVFALEALGRELDRGQRVLDLGGDASGDIGPGSLALRRQQLGDVVEGDNEAADFLRIVLGGDAHQKGAGAVAAGDLHLRLGQPIGTTHRLFQEAGHLRRDLGQVFADRQVEIDAQQGRRGAVGEVDPAGAIEADDPCRYPGQHRLGKPAPLIQLAVGLDQLALLRLDLIGHPVEGATQ